MLSKNKIKYIQSLSRKKIRDTEKAFLVEGDKMVTEALESSLTVETLCATTDFLRANRRIVSGDTEVIEATADEIRKASLLQSPQNALAIVSMPEIGFDLGVLNDKLSLALDFIQDPGNLGTIIRLADWFGIKHVICSENTVDCFNPKVIQASMGAIFRVQMHYINLPAVLGEASQSGIPIFGAFLEGENIYKQPLSSSGILVMGNEGNGISTEVGALVSDKVHIPSFAAEGSESLNVSMATAICLSEFRRRQL
ncbi:TrmH family RNA methyltransferase [Mangrovibacterium sp.]|uniref:TrmH family RNA methyltransferase n=1 Tax=Mangrovibacterium sp. TaxID=1961364 RepID=UPI00356A5ED4